MSTRWIASVGVVLCAAMTSFSIYLGVVEHVYTPKAIGLHADAALDGRHFICEKIQRWDNTTTTSGAVPQRPHGLCVSMFAI
ncbi:MAG TPA: hypothetical protein VGZ03_00765 [Acidimicrobiales bacterium]|jgi:hypothetical protein|nr:hypothetical protein [Acidimicrobiales bacterium]